MIMKEKKKVKVAVIGSGLAGLSSAYLLSQNEDVQVHLFEKNSSVGMDAASISVGPNKDFRIDVPMRSFMSGYYSHLFKLYEHLKIPAKQAKFSFGWYRIKQMHNSKKSVSPEQVASFTHNESYLVYSGARTIGHLDMIHDTRSTTLDFIYDIFRFLWRSCVVAFSYLWLMFISLWMYYRGHLQNNKHPICNMTLGQFFKKYRVHSYFVHEVFVPLFAAVCTNSYQSMLNYPASDILEYMAVGLFQESYVVSCGVQKVVEKLSKPLDHVHLETQINSILSNKNHPDYRFEIIDEHGVSYDIDHIIFATQGNQACQLIQQYIQSLKDEKASFDEWKENQEPIITIAQQQMDMLSTFNYDTALVINHTDARLLPSNPSNWKALNLAMVDKSVDPGDSNLIVPYPHDTTMATHILNFTHNGIKTEEEEKQAIYMQTTNPCISVDPKKVLSVAWFERATVTLDSKKALENLFVFNQETNEYELGPCQGTNNIWFVGSYCWKGIPLLEGCVASAEYVVTKGIATAERIHIPVPY